MRGRIASRLNGAEDLGAASAEIRSWILALDLPSGLEETIAAAHASRIGEDAFVAVRSSAAGKDAAGESFAGLHDRRIRKTVGTEVYEILLTATPLPVDPRHNSKIDYGKLRERLRTGSGL